MKIVLTSILENISTRSDGSVKVTLGSQEMDESNAAHLFGLRNKFIKVLLSDNNISPLEERMIDEQKIQDGKKIKTRSQRYRAVIYRQWEQSASELDFDTFYNNHMDNIIEVEKSKLE